MSTCVSLGAMDPPHHSPQVLLPCRERQRKGEELLSTDWLVQRMPPQAWDSHMHVVDPSAYPLSEDAVYQPFRHSVEDAIAFGRSIGLSNMVLVQPSIYGYDNSCLLDAMRRLGPAHCRGVVAFDPASTSASSLQSWHALGVRGVRINLQSVARSMDGHELRSLLGRYAAAVRPLGWIIQLYIPMEMIASLQDMVPQLGIRICIDHLGQPSLPGPAEFQMTKNPYRLPGFAALVSLLQQGQTFCKLSAPYRSSGSDPDSVQVVARELIRVAGHDRLVFGSDWPHTRFEGLNIRPWMESVLDWCAGDDKLVERLFRSNAMDLWMLR